MIVGSVSVVIKVLNAESNLNYVCGFNSNRSVNTHFVWVMKTGHCYVGKSLPILSFMKITQMHFVGRTQKG